MKDNNCPSNILIMRLIMETIIVCISNTLIIKVFEMTQQKAAPITENVL